MQRQYKDVVLTLKPIEEGMKLLARRVKTLPPPPGGDKDVDVGREEDALKEKDKEPEPDLIMDLLHMCEGRLSYCMERLDALATVDPHKGQSLYAGDNVNNNRVLDKKGNLIGRIPSMAPARAPA